MEEDEVLVEMAVSDLKPQPRDIETQDILHAAIEEFVVTREELVSSSRAHRIALPRQVVMHLLQEGNALSFPEIGELLGSRDHTTIICGHERSQTR